MIIFFITAFVLGSSAIYSSNNQGEIRTKMESYGTNTRHVREVQVRKRSKKKAPIKSCSCRDQQTNNIKTGRQ